jgi:hypothetical protein
MLNFPFASNQKIEADDGPSTNGTVPRNFIISLLRTLQSAKGLFHKVDTKLKIGKEGCN